MLDLLAYCSYVVVWADIRTVNFATGLSPEEIARLIQFYKQSLIISTWLKMKKENKEALPKTEKELQDMQNNDRRIQSISMKIMMGNGKRPGRGQKMPY